MESKLKSLNRALKSYDPELYAQVTRLPRIDVYRKSKFNCNPPNYIFSLTEDWSTKSNPVPWSTDIVINRLKAHDLWNQPDFMNNYIEGLKKDEEIKTKRRMSSTEDFLRDFRRQFAKAFDGINTSTMKKLYRKEGSHGYCEPRS